ncbi:MAG: cell wall hydrolase [Eubacteriales bacterium]|nr:cell wall hydrolase [Eubacteriales bacterium]
MKKTVCSIIKIAGLLLAFWMITGATQITAYAAETATAGAVAESGETIGTADVAAPAAAESAAQQIIGVADAQGASAAAAETTNAVAVAQETAVAVADVQSAAAAATETVETVTVAAESAQASAVDEELMILAAIIYCEAGTESHEGKVAVGNVVLNRVASPKFPNTIREVVYQQGQFTPAACGRLDTVLANGSVPADCIQAAQDALAGTKPVGECIFFNGTTHKSEGIVIGGHRFFGSM